MNFVAAYEAMPAGPCTSLETRFLTNFSSSPSSSSSSDSTELMYSEYSSCNVFERLSQLRMKIINSPLISLALRPVKFEIVSKTSPGIPSSNNSLNRRRSRHAVSLMRSWFTNLINDSPGNIDTRKLMGTVRSWIVSYTWPPTAHYTLGPTETFKPGSQEFAYFCTASCTLLLARSFPPSPVDCRAFGRTFFAAVVSLSDTKALNAVAWYIRPYRFRCFSYINKIVQYVRDISSKSRGIRRWTQNREICSYGLWPYRRKNAYII